MQRDIQKLQEREFDLLIVGGGIYGVCAAWDASLRGLAVALIEKGDFGAATSSNSLKIIHGGLRYLQHADFKRMRESITERRVLMRIAPHLVHPLPCVIPVYGHGVKGKEAMSVALWLNDLVGYDRNRLADPQKHLPRSRMISPLECRRRIPGLDETGLTGGALWYDCQVRNSERLLMAMLHSATRAGAVAANYVEMLDFTVEGERVTGVRARDQLSGSEFAIRSRLVLNAAGPWFKDVLHRLNGHAPDVRIELSSAMNLVVGRRLFDGYAVGIPGKTEFRDDDAVISKGSRLFFITPWREYSLIGTTHARYEGAPDAFRVGEQDVRRFIAEVNDAYPPAQLRREDVLFYYGGLLPADGFNPQTGDVKLLKNYQIIDHKQESGLDGLVSIVSVKFTTARDVASKAIDCVLRKLGRSWSATRTHETSVWGGDIECFDTYLEKEKARAYASLPETAIEHLVYNYGSAYAEVLRSASEQGLTELAQVVEEKSRVLRAEIIHSIRHEMALHLSDVVRRRTELGSAGCPSEAVLEACAQIMARELGWDRRRIAEEIDQTTAIYETA